MDRVSSFGLLSLIFIFMSAVFVVKVDAEGLTPLRRQKREWIIPPQKLRENYYYRNVFIAKIRSDTETRTSIRYSLIGKGANMDPVGLFTVDPLNGDVRVNGMLDREETSRYELQGVASFMNGSLAERNLDLVITVEDENDNDPIFQIVKAGSVFELSKKATFVMKITATDADIGENAEISYRILESSPMGDMFYINHETGEIFVKQDSLDREMHASYTLKVIGSDMNGKTGCRTGTGSVVINLLDVNDNVPTLEKPNYIGIVQENTINVEVMRMKVVDLDIEFINQLSVFTMVSGNEAGYFLITTDEKTNEGVITVIKALDYEELKELDIKVEVRNKATYHSSVQSVGSTAYPIKIKVTNQLEGPKFKPAVKSFTISETSTIHTVIGTYAAIDEDTGKTATNVRYIKVVDRDNWLIINENTGEIKLNKIPDRESSFVINGTYVAEIICITNDLPSKTATGTVVIQVEDENDHCPTLPSLSQEVCAYEDAVVVSAEDADPDPNGAPFEYLVIPDSTKLKWTVERINDTSAVLRSHENLWPGQYQLAVEVSDQQGKTCGPQVLDLMVQPCFLGIGGGPRSPPPSPVFGAPGVGFLLLALLLLLLVPLLLMYCTCGGKGPFAPQFPMEPSQHLINYHTEGPGEDQECPRLIVPVEVDGPVITKSEGAGLGAGWVGQGGMGQASGAGLGLGWMEDSLGFGQGSGKASMSSAWGKTAGSYLQGTKDISWTGIEAVSRGPWDGIALSEAYLEDYYTQKSGCADGLRAQEDQPQIYDYEGDGSAAGSVGCCSDLDVDNDLSFLNDLDIKFKSLAEVCRGSELQYEVSHTMAASFPPQVPVTPLTATVNLNETSASSTATFTHTEVVKEAVLRPPSPAPSPRLVTETSHTVSTTASLPRVHLTENIGVPSPAYLVQSAPVFLAPTPVIQATHYVVEAPQPQLLRGPTLLVTDSGVNQGLVRVDSPGPGPHNLLVVERQVTQESLLGAPQVLVQRTGPSASQNLLITNAGVNQGLIRVDSPGPGSQNLLVVERQVTQESLVGPLQALSRSASPSGTQNLLVTNAGVNQGIVRAESPGPGSHNLLVVESQVTQESLVGPPQALSRSASPSGTQNLLVTDAGVNPGFIRAESPEPGSHNLLVVERQVTQESLVGPPHALSRSASPSGTQNLLVTNAGVNQGFIRAESPEPGSHNLLVVERQVTQESLMGPPQALSRSASPSGTQNLLMTDAGVNQDIVRAESPGSHNLLVVERQVTQESLVGPPQALSRSGSPSGSQNLLVMENSQLLQVREGFPDFKLSPSPDSETQKENTSSSASSQEGAELKMAVSSGAHSMVLQEKQISISEKSVQQISTSADHTPI